MKHIIKYLLLILIASFVLAPAVYAQDGSTGMALPKSATEAVTLLASLLAAVWGGGHLGNLFTDLLKRLHWGILSDGQKAQLGGLIAEAAAMLLSVGSAFVVANYLLPLGEYLDHNGLYPILLAAWPVARELYTRRRKQPVY